MLINKLSNATPEDYRKLSPFKTVDQLNEAIQAHLYAHSHELSKSAIAVFKLIKNDAAKYRGVAFIKYDNIAEACSVSYATVKRAMRTLKKCGIVDVYRTTRTKGEVKGGYGHNVIVIKPADLSSDPSRLNHRKEAEDTDIPNDQQAETGGEAVPSEADTNKDIINNTSCDSSSRPYSRFKKAIRQFIDAKQRTISRLYGGILRKRNT
ncbi:helix-turn-helix domain-containing protein [Alteribacillus sp. JSM 102045]|uniref:helix-turn-helix domain-containing protein n=1 Tax=Alteribacillus sp. JSM 102045 TaxID=1562101 RepID=UPI0035BF19FD